MWFDIVEVSVSNFKDLYVSRPGRKLDAGLHFSGSYQLDSDFHSLYPHSSPIFQDQDLTLNSDCTF